MKKALLKYLLLGLLCIISSGCAASMSSNKVGVSPNLPAVNLQEDNTLIPQDNTVNIANDTCLANFIAKYNCRLNNDEARIIASNIITISNMYQVDYRVITALVAIESGFRPEARSSSGAIGLGQLMPATAKHLNVNNPFDPRENLDGAIRLLRNHIEKYNGNINYALAAYKMGAGTVSRYGISQPETIKYIQNIRKVFDNIP